MTSRQSERIVVGNALEYQPARRFDFVRTGLEYVLASSSSTCSRTSDGA